MSPCHAETSIPIRGFEQDPYDASGDKAGEAEGEASGEGKTSTGAAPPHPERDNTIIKSVIMHKILFICGII